MNVMHKEIKHVQPAKARNKLINQTVVTKHVPPVPMGPIASDKQHPTRGTDESLRSATFGKGH